jgi:hypothetical protein
METGQIYCVVCSHLNILKKNLLPHSKFMQQLIKRFLFSIRTEKPNPRQLQWWAFVVSGIQKLHYTRWAIGSWENALERLVSFKYYNVAEVMDELIIIE